MMKGKKLRLYYNSPWKTAEQTERYERVKLRLRELGFKIWDPREHFFNDLLISYLDEKEKIEKFNLILEAIKESDYIFSIVDDNDFNTLWQAGFAFGFYKKIIYYTENIIEDIKQLDLMLTCSASMIVTGFEDLGNLLKLPEIVLQRKGEENVRKTKDIRGQ